MALPYIPGDIRQRQYKVRTFLDDLTRYEVQKHCAMPKENVRELIEEFAPKLGPRTDRNCSIKAESKIITSLSFFRSGSFQYVEGTVGGISQPSQSRILDQFSDIIIRDYVNEFLKFPTERRDLNELKALFHSDAYIPNVVGLIDGTHIPIKAPSEDEPAFVNRKGYHSINAQLTCSPNYSILDAVVKWPGSTHDSYIWNNSALKHRFTNGEFGESWLLGDSGYPAEPFLLTPFLNPATAHEKRFNRAQKKTRSIVERAIGVWKARFRSMDHSGGCLCYEPKKCCKLILVSLVLHNYCIGRRIPLNEPDQHYADNYHEDDDMTAPKDIMDTNCGVVTRENLVQNYFTV